MGAAFHGQWVLMHMVEYHLRMFPIIEAGSEWEASLSAFVSWAAGD